MELKPSVFIGSSSEGLDIATETANLMKDFAECNLWKNVFDLNSSYYENLTSKISLYDYAILVATKDDLLSSRNTLFEVPRDNVIFESGLFAGGLGRSRVFYMVEKGVKVFSDLTGITLPSFKREDKDTLTKAVERIRKHIEDKESTYDLGFLPSTALAYGYFTNFVERTVERLLEDRAEGKQFHLASGQDFKISELKFTILIPDDLSSDMFTKVKAKRLKEGWQKLKVDPKDVRDYDFSVDVTKVSEGIMHLVDIPFTLNALNKSIEMYSAKSHIGKDTKERLLEDKEIRNFKRTLEYLVNQSSMTKGIVEISVVDI